MTTIRKFCCNDFLRYASVNLDHFIINASMRTYCTWLIQWPDYFVVALAPGNRIMGYLLAGVQERDERWFGQVSTVSVHPEYRRRGLGTKLVRLFESELLYKMHFSTRALEYCMRIFIVVSNKPAIKFFRKFGFQEYRGGAKIYIKKEKGLDMRKILVEERLRSIYD